MTCSFEMTLPSFSVFWANEMTRLGASRPANCTHSGGAGDDHSGWGGGASKLHTQKHAPLGRVLTIHEGCRCTGDGGRRGAEDSAHPQTDRNFATQNKNSRSNSMEPGSRAPPPYLDRGEGCSVVSPLTHLDRGERCSVCLQRLALLLLERVELHEALGHCRPARAAAGSSMVVMRSWVHIADVCRMVWCGMTAEDSMRHERANGRRCGVQRGYCPGPQTSRESGQPAARPHEMWNDSCMKSLAAWFYMGELAPGNSSGSPPAPQ